MIRIWLWLQSEEVPEKIQIGLHAQKSFTKVNKNGNMNYVVRIQMKNFQFIEVEQASEEIRRRGLVPALQRE
jgi:hypothetical protein